MRRAAGVLRTQLPTQTNWITASLFQRCLRCCFRVGVTFGFVLASLVTQVAVGDVHSGQRVTRGSATVNRLYRWVKAHKLKRCLLVLRLYLWSTPEVLPISMSGHNLGSVDCWLCQIFTRSLGTALPSIRALSVWRGMGFLLLRGVCSGLVTGGNAGQAPLRTAPWGTQWGQLNWLPAAIVPCALSRQVIGVASATPFLVHSAPLGVLPWCFGAKV
jgi:hypothetical protein